MPRVYPPIEGAQRNSALTMSPSLVESIAGFTAGIVSTLVVHPFDLIKTRLQVDKTRMTTAAAMKQIAKEAQFTGWKNGRVLRDGSHLMQAYYRGLMVNMAGNSVSWALYFMWYSHLKEIVRVARGGTETISSDYFIASGLSGVLTAVFTNPVWVVKTRLLAKGRDNPEAYKNAIDGFVKTWKDEGVKGFYRGMLPSLFGVSHGAVQLSAYENLKKWRLSQHGRPDGLTNVDYLAMSAISKMFAGTITYPYQVVRARLQTQEAPAKYKSATDVVKKVYAAEGFKGFFRGLVPNLVRVVPSTCVTFVVYENAKIFLNGSNG